MYPSHKSKKLIVQSGNARGAFSCVLLAKTLALQRLQAFLALDMLVWRAMLTADANPLRAQALVVEIVHQQLRLTKVYCSEFHLSLMARLNRFERTREPFPLLFMSIYRCT